MCARCTSFIRQVVNMLLDAFNASFQLLIFVFFFVSLRAYFASSDSSLCCVVAVAVVERALCIARNERDLWAVDKINTHRHQDATKRYCISTNKTHAVCGNNNNKDVFGFVRFFYSFHSFPSVHRSNVSRLILCIARSWGTRTP